DRLRRTVQGEVWWVAYYAVKPRFGRDRPSQEIHAGKVLVAQGFHTLVVIQIDRGHLTCGDPAPPHRLQEHPLAHARFKPTVSRPIRKGSYHRLREGWWGEHFTVCR